MYSFARSYRAYVTDRPFLRSLAAGLLILVLALILNSYTGQYSADKASNPVTDIILDNTRVYDVHWIFIYGIELFYAFVFILGVLRPYKVPFTLKAIGLFILIRSIFVILTHIGPFPTQVAIDSHFFKELGFADGLFFSAHTGLPFLFALIFWHNRYLRYFFIAAAIIFGCVVLMGHLHYSIDVLAAFFITYSIYRLAEFLFKEDRQMFFRNNSAVVATAEL